MHNISNFRNEKADFDLYAFRFHTLIDQFDVLQLFLYAQQKKMWNNLAYASDIQKNPYIDASSGCKKSSDYSTKKSINISKKAGGKSQN